MTYRETVYQQVNVVDQDGNIITSFGGGTGGGGDASAANQQQEISALQVIETNIGTSDITGTVMPSGGTGIRGWLSALWKLINTSLSNGRFLIDGSQVTQPVSVIPAVTTTLPIATDGTTGNKTIISSSGTGKRIYISSLYFATASSALITLKSGNTALSGQMSLSAIAADFNFPMALGLNKDFVIDIETAIPINGFVVYWEA